MQILVTVVAIVVLAIGISLSQRQNKIGYNSQPQKEEVLSESLNPVDAEELEDNGQKAEVTIPPTSTVRPRAGSPTIEIYKYPGSKVTNLTENSVALESNENVDVITNWYKEKISVSGMNIKTFVVTKANDNILNKLVGANAEGEISVEIEQKKGESNVTI